MQLHRVLPAATWLCRRVIVDGGTATRRRHHASRIMPVDVMLRSAPPSGTGGLQSGNNAGAGRRRLTTSRLALRSTGGPGSVMPGPPPRAIGSHRGAQHLFHDRRTARGSISTASSSAPSTPALQAADRLAEPAVATAAVQVQRRSDPDLRKPRLGRARRKRRVQRGPSARRRRR